MPEKETSYQDLLTPRSEVEKRIASLQERLREASLEGILCLHPVHIFYFSGTVQNGILWVPGEGPPRLWVIRNLERAREESPLPEIFPREDLKNIARVVPPGPETRIGLEMDVLPQKEFQRIRKLLPERAFVDAAALIQQVRQIKSPFEVSWLRRAGRLHAQVFKEIPTWIREGQTELDLSARIEYGLRVCGHQGLVRVHRWNMDLFYGPVVSGTSACYPSGFDGPVGAQGLYPAVPQGAGQKRIVRGEPILVDLVFGYNGYFVDKSRTFFLGKPAEEYMEAHDLCREIQEAVVSRFIPGKSCSSVYREVMEAFENTGPFWPHFMGCRENKVRFLGHGVGLELDEWPVLAAGFKEPLQPGMAIAVEPKFFPPGKGGIGLENTFLVTEAGPEKLTDFPDDPVVVT